MLIVSLSILETLAKGLHIWLQDPRTIFKEPRRLVTNTCDIVIYLYYPWCKSCNVRFTSESVPKNNIIFVSFSL